jgi:glycosyltransferase involved in cell wall biosynthesis
MHLTRGCGSWNPVLNYVRFRAVGRSLGALRRLPVLQVMSGSVRRQLIANGIPEEKITSLPPYAPPPTGARHEGYTSVRTVLHVGGILGQKGVWMVVRMIRQLPKDVQIVFAGGGAEREMLESHVRRRGLGDRVRIVGEATPEQWSLLYREATLVIMPVLWNEPLGLEGLGAMAYGKPVVAFDTEGIREWLSDGETGVCVPFGGRRAFREAVGGLLEDRDRLHGMGRRAREVWQSKFRPENHLNALVAHYEKMQKEALS